MDGVGGEKKSREVILEQYSSWSAKRCMWVLWWRGGLETVLYMGLGRWVNVCSKRATGAISG